MLPDLRVFQAAFAMARHRTGHACTLRGWQGASFPDAWATVSMDDSEADSGEGEVIPGVNDCGTVVIAASNSPQALDPSDRASGLPAVLVPAADPQETPETCFPHVRK